MKSIFVPANNETPPFIVQSGNSSTRIDTVDGRELLGDLAPFHLNPVQSAFYAFYDQKTSLVSTPTGSGKTVIAFLAAFNRDRRLKKTLYIAPTRALARQIFHEMQNKTFKVYLRTGESKMDVKENFDWVVATPEAYLAARHSYSPWTETIEFAIIDEVHMLLQDTRGIVYEETLVQLLGDQKELLLLSATIPDALSLANWVNADLLIESNWRPVPLQRYFVNIALPSRKSAKTTIKQMKAEFLTENIEQNVKTMIIVPSKKNGWELLAAFEQAGMRALNETVPYIKPVLDSQPVIAFHNADIPVEEKIEIESAFKEKEKGVSILISTQTLAYGFNSPADDIIIFVKYSMYQEEKIWPTLIDLLQFEGRAGRKGLTKRGVGRVFYSTGSTGEKTAVLLKAQLKKGLADRFETTLDRAFTTLNNLYTQHYSEFHPANETALLGSIELFSLGIISVNEEKFAYTHYKGKSKATILSKACQRLADIGMLEKDHRLSKLGKLTASYLLNPETVSSFANNIKKAGIDEDEPPSFWKLWESIAMLIPTSGAIPNYYPPFFPALDGNWDRNSVFFKSYSGVVKQGLGFLWTKIGIGEIGKYKEARRQKPPAWIASLFYDVDLICSFYLQGANYGFWGLQSGDELERIKRSLVYGVPPQYSLMTRVPGIGSIRANLNSLMADFYGKSTDLEWLAFILQNRNSVESLWSEFRLFLHSYYSLQIQWLQKTLEISGEVSLDYLLNLDKEAFFESLNIFHEFFLNNEKRSTFRFDEGFLLEESCFTRFKKQIAIKYPKYRFFFFVEEDGKEKPLNQIPFVLADAEGIQQVLGTIYPEGHLPSSLVLSFQDKAVRRIHSDLVDTIWEEENR